MNSIPDETNGLQELLNELKTSFKDN